MDLRMPKIRVCFRGRMSSVERHNAELRGRTLADGPLSAGSDDPGHYGETSMKFEIINPSDARDGQT